jgi:hypothetical protein
MSSASTVKSELSLPALRGLNELADAVPTLVQDTREQIGIPFRRLSCVRGTLSEGDYAILGVTDFSIEVKRTLDEFSSCCIGHNRDRFERELFRLRPYKFKRLLLITGAVTDADVLNYPYRSRISPKAVLSSLYSFQARFDLPYVLVPSPQAAAERIENWALFWAREVCHSANGLLRAYWRSAKAKLPAADVGSESHEPEESN